MRKLLALYLQSKRILATISVLLLNLYNRGCSLVLLGGFSPREFLQTVQKYKVTSFSGVPTIYSILNTLPDYAKYPKLKYKVNTKIDTSHV